MSKEEKKRCELLWAREKYLVLRKSQSSYKKIREYLKNDKVTLSVLESYIEDALNLSENTGEVVNAYLHVWGYFKNHVDEAEKKTFFEIISEYQSGTAAAGDIKEYIKKLLIKYPNSYLEQSSLLSCDN